MEKAREILLTLFSEFGDESTKISNSKNGWETMICQGKGGSLWLSLFISVEYLSFEIWESGEKAKKGERSLSSSCFKIAFAFLTDKKLHAHIRLNGYSMIEEQGNLTEKILLFAKIQDRFIELWENS